ncbi:MAG: hypothetical protein ACO20H_03790 [Bacteriovoracaceae bacterium]
MFTSLDENKKNFLTISFLSLAFFIFQFAIMREIKFQVPTVIFGGPLVICIALVFTGIGPLLAQKLIKGSHKRFNIILYALPFIAFLSFLCLIFIAHSFGPYYSPEEFYKVVSSEITKAYSPPFLIYLSILLCGPIVVFILQGVVLGHFLNIGKKQNKLGVYYCFDMVGAGLGAIMAGLLTMLVSPFKCIIISCLLFTTPLIKKNIKFFLSISTLLIIIFLSVNEFDLTTPNFLKKNNNFSEWGPYQRVDIINKNESIEVYSDGMLFYPVYKDPRNSIVSVGHEVANKIMKKKEVKDLLMIGTGAGSDIYSTRFNNFKDIKIHAVEIDPTFIKASQSTPWLYKQYSTANIINQEGRSFLETSNMKYDMIYYASADPKAGLSQASIPDAAYLYTQESFNKALELLKPNGTLIVKIAYILDNEEIFLNKLFNTLKSSISNQYLHPLLISKSSYSIDFAKIKAVYGVIENKTHPTKGLFDNLSHHKFAKVHPFSTTITTDRSPINISARSVDLNILFITFFCVLFIFYLMNKFNTKGTTLGGQVYFYLLGLAWMLTQLSFQFNSFLLIGTPHLSISLTLGVSLIFNALGSYYFKNKQLQSNMTALIIIYFSIYMLLTPYIIYNTITWSGVTRILCYLLTISPVSFIMGAVFPLALERIKKITLESALLYDFVGISFAPLIFWVLLHYEILVLNYFILGIYLLLTLWITRKSSYDMSGTLITNS